MRYFTIIFHNIIKLQCVFYTHSTSQVLDGHKWRGVMVLGSMGLELWNWRVPEHKDTGTGKSQRSGDELKTSVLNKSLHSEQWNLQLPLIQKPEYSNWSQETWPFSGPWKKQKQFRGQNKSLRKITNFRDLVEYIAPIKQYQDTLKMKKKDILKIRKYES